MQHKELAIGMVTGLAIGFATDHVGIGLILGVAFGLVLAKLAKRRRGGPGAS